MKRAYRHPMLILLSSLFLIMVLLFQGAESASRKFTEDFTTRLYCDTLATTAWWDSVAGEIKLHEFRPSEIGTLPVGTGQEGLSLFGNYLFIGSNSGFNVVDVSDPADPDLIGTSATSAGKARMIVTAGNYAFVGTHANSIDIFDITDPEVPVLADSVTLADYATNQCLSGNYLYVAGRTAGLVVIDVSDPLTASIVATIDTLAYTYGIDVDGDYAYVGCSSFGGVYVVDVSDPTAPSVAAFYDLGYSITDVHVNGDHLFMGAALNGLQIMDISDPLSAYIAGSYTASGSVYAVDVSSGVAAIGTLSGTDAFILLDVSDPTDPKNPVECFDGFVRDIKLAGDMAYATTASGLKVFNAAEPVSPLSVEGTVPTSGSAENVTIAGTLAYVADRLSGVHIVDISDPSSPVRLGGVATFAKDVAVQGDYAYVASDNPEWFILDVSEPDVPVEVSRSIQPPIRRSQGVAVDGNYMYLCYDHMMSGGGVIVLDISDPENPVEVDDWTGINYTEEILVDGDYLYVTDQYTGVKILDISVPAAPVQVGIYTTPGASSGLDVDGDLLMIADNFDGVHAVDISDPSSPSLIGTFATNMQAFGVRISGDYAFIAETSDGVTVIDISDPAIITAVDTVETTGSVLGIDFAGNLVVTASGTAGAEVIEVFNRFLAYPDQDVVQSEPVPLDDTAAHIWFNATYVDSIVWEYRTPGFGWEVFVPDGRWYSRTATEVEWRTTHVIADRDVNPAASMLEIGWLSDVPVIESIMDIPGDQGKQVRVTWSRSAGDMVGSSPQVVEYAVYRKVDPGLSALYVPDGRLRPPLDLPPGDWDYLMSAPADAEDEYSVVVPTLADSASSGIYYSTFFIRAVTDAAGVLYEAHPDSGYSVDNLAPEPPLGLVVSRAGTGANELTWYESPESDFKQFHIYRYPASEQVPEEKSPVHVTTGTSWSDPVEDGWEYCYALTAVDLAGNESGASEAVTVTGDDLPAVPYAYALYQNAPNPFNPVTTIFYDLPARAHVRLEIFNIKGELIRTLLDSDMPAGNLSVTWNGTDDSGRAVASGIYFYRFRAADFTRSRKMVLLR